MATELVAHVLANVDLPALMDFACTVLAYDCSEVPLPEVVFEPLYQTYGAFGGFNPEAGAIIYVDSQMVPYLDEPYIQSIVVHELTHYIDWQLHGSEMIGDLCAAESRGWRVGNAWLMSSDRPDLVDFSWNIRYGCYQ